MSAKDSHVKRPARRFGGRKFILPVLLAVVVVAAFVAGPRLLAYISDLQKPIEASVSSVSEATFGVVEPQTHSKVSLDKGETAMLDGLQVTLLGYDASGVEIKVPANERNELLLYAQRPTIFHVDFGDTYEYKDRPDCCDKPTLHTQITFRKR